MEILRLLGEEAIKIVMIKWFIQNRSLVSRFTCSGHIDRK